MNGIPWTEKEISLLTKLWERGLSASLIAQEFRTLGYKFTRNSVVGKLHRLGLKESNRLIEPDVVGVPIRKRVNGSAPRVKIRKKPTPSSAKRPDQGKRSPMINPRPESRVLLTQTNDSHCRAIIGYENGEAARAVCCGEETVWSEFRGKRRRLSWCEYHYKLYLTEPHK